MNKKVIAAVTAFAMLTSTFSMVFASSDSMADSKVQQSTYSDISGHWASEAIDKWSGYGVISGNQGLFRPNASITRGEMACILNNIMDYQISAKNTFSDLKDGQFYTSSVLKANAAGIMNGDGAAKLRPTDKITREEAAVMLSKAFAVSNGDTAGTKFTDAETIATWAKSSVSGMEAKGYIKGNDGKYNPKANITRAETVAIINNIVKAYYTKAGTYTDNVEGTAVVKVSDVVLKGTTVSGNLIIAEGVGKGDATLDSVMVKGNTVVRGGGENSIHIEGNSSMQNIQIQKNGEKLRIVVADGSNVKNIEVADGEEIIITGSVGTVEISASGVNVQATGANITNAFVTGSNSSITLDKASKIGEVSVGEKADNTAIKTEKGASVGKITAAAKTAVSGNGTVKEVNLNEGAKDSSITTPDTQIKAAAGVTGVTAAGGTAIAAGSTITNNSNGDGVVKGQIPTQVPVPSGGGSTGGNSGGSGNSGGNGNSGGTDNPSVTPVSVDAINPITVAIGTTADKLGLTATVGVKLSNGETAKANITWNTANFDGSKPGDVILNGTLSVPAGNTWTITDAQKAVSIKVTVRAAAALEVKSVSTINSRTIEVSLDKETTTADIAVTAFTVEKTTNAAINIVNTAIAPWSDKSVLVTLDTDTVAGMLYTLGIGSKTYCFGGIAVDIDQPVVSYIEATDTNEVTITFSEPVKLDGAKFAIAEAYGSKAAVAVNSVKCVQSNKVILSIGNMNGSTLYKSYITGVTDLAGNQLDSTSRNTFVGVATPIPAKPVEVNSVNATSNTSFTVSFKQKLDKTSAETIANYTFAEMYGTKAILTILKVELAANGTDIKFTTTAMNPTTEYGLTIVNLKDTRGNVYTSTDPEKVKVVGIDVADKISAINSITRTLPYGSAVIIDKYTQIVVEFDKNVGSNATDVSLYSIDNGIGYPSKAATIDGVGNENKVMLTMGSTNSGAPYKLTVKGLLNSDGIAMEDSGVSSVFAGLSNPYKKPKMLSASAIDKQTIRISFDRNVNSPDINGESKIWTTNGVNAGALRIKYAGQDDSVYKNLPVNKAWQDPDELSALIIRTSGEDTFVSSSMGSQFVLTGTVVLLDKDNYNISFASNDSEVALPKITNIDANNKNAITVYFDQAVNITGNSPEVFTIGTSEDTLTNPIAIADEKPFKVNDRTYIVFLTGSLTNNSYYLRVSDLQRITDKSGAYSLKPSEDNGNYTAVSFIGTDVSAPVKIINGVSVLMTDKHTIKVYYPEKMDRETVTDVNNYRVYDNTLSKTAVPTAVVYDADPDIRGGYVATLYFSGSNLSQATGFYVCYLGIKDTVKNESGIKAIKNDRSLPYLGYGISSAFAGSVSEDAKPKIKNVTVDLNDNTKVTVEFDEAVSTVPVAEILKSGIATADNQIVINDGQWGTGTTSSAIDLFAITDTTTGSAVSIVSVRKVSNTKFEIVTATPIDVKYSYLLSIGNRKTIYNLGGTQVETYVDNLQMYMFTSSK